MRRIFAVSIVCVLSLLAAAARASASEEMFGSSLTNSGGDLRTGWYPNQSVLSPELVEGGTFGRLWTTPVEGQVYAQPLLDDGTLFVATEKNDLYGLNPTTGAQEWTDNLGEPWNPEEISCADLAPKVGVTSTPVIDPETNVAYLTYKTYSHEKEEPEWFMDAVSVSTGEQEPNFPVLLNGTAQNVASGYAAQEFHPRTQLQRPGLLLMEGVVYAAFGSDCDTPRWQGWVFGVSTTGAVKARWVADEIGEGAGIWQSGAGLTSDGPGTMLLSTGNGGSPTTPTPGDQPPGDLGESIVRLDVHPDGALKAVDFFAPFNASTLDTWDADFASGGVTGLPEEYFGTLAIPHLAVAVGKDGYVYLLNRDNLGGIGQGPSGSDDVVQRIGPYGGVWSRPGVWPGEGGWVYIPTASGGTSASGSSGNLRVYQYGVSGTGAPTLSLQATSSEAFGFSSSAPIITSDKTIPGSALVWIVWAPNGSGEGAQLRAYKPVPVDGEPVMVWSAPIGTSAKFATPGVGGGRLYVGTRDGHVIAFGSPVTPILSGSPTAFGTTTIGDSAEQSLTLMATESLTLSKLDSSSSQFTLGTPSLPLPAELTTGQTIEVPITFSPTGSGPIGGMVTATTNTGKTASFGLSGIGQVAAAKLEVSPLVVTFDGTTVGEHASAGATFRNVGGTPLTIDKVNLPSAPFGVEGPPAVGATIEPGGSITITVTFNPTEAGAFNGEIGLETTGGNEAIALSGAAGPPGALEVKDEVVEYGQVAVGSSESKSFTVTNTGGTAVEITKSKPPIGGAFEATTSLSEGTTIAPGESVTETVKFTPTEAGPASADWPINGKDATGLHDVRFKGVGVEPPAMLSGSPIAFGTTTIGGSSEEMLTLTATEPLTLSKLESSSSQFTLGTPSSPLPATLTTGQTIKVPITFSPTASGPTEGMLTATTSTGKTASFGLSGIGQVAAAKLEVSPRLVTFDDTAVGEHGSAGATFRNVGGTPLTIEKVNLPSAPFGGEDPPAAGATIEPGGSITIMVTFNPTEAGAFNGEIGLETTGGDEAIDLSGAASLPGGPEIGKTLVQPIPGSLGGLGSSSVPGTKTPRFLGAQLAATALTASASGMIDVRVSCPAGESRCAGRITLRTRIPARAAAGAHSEALKLTSVTLAEGSFTVAGGRVNTITLRLSGKARALLARTHVLRVQATVASHDPAGATYTVQANITIRAPRKPPVRKAKTAG